MKRVGAGSHLPILWIFFRYFFDFFPIFFDSLDPFFYFISQFPFHTSNPFYGHYRSSMLRFTILYIDRYDHVIATSMMTIQGSWYNNDLRQKQNLRRISLRSFTLFSEFMSNLKTYLF